MSELAAKANAWIVGGDTGSSSKCMWAVMMGVEPGRWKSYPLDAGDLGRCLRLLTLIPEWETRVGEMSKLSPYWAALVSNWPALKQTMIEETGTDFKGHSAPRTYKMMKAILDPIERKDSRPVNLGPGMSIRFGA